MQQRTCCPCRPAAPAAATAATHAPHARLAPRLGRLACGLHPLKLACKVVRRPNIRLALRSAAAWLRLVCTNTRPARVICLQLERRAEQLAAAAAERKRLEAEVAELKAAQQAQQGGGEEDEEGAAAAAEVIAVLKQQLQAAQAAAAKVGGWRAGLCKHTVSGH